MSITAAVTHSPLRTGRCILSSIYGSLFSLTILLPELNNAVNLAVKSAAAASIVALAFGLHGKKRLLINTIAFFAANFVLAGTVYSVYSLLSPSFVHFNNGSFYIDFSLMILIITTAALYAAIWLIRLWTDRAPEGNYTIYVRSGKKILTVSGLADTGNCLVDWFTGSPVIVCSADSYIQLTGSHFDISKLPKGFRIIPCSAVCGDGLIPVFRPDEVLIASSSNGERKTVDAVIGFGEHVGKAVFNPKLLKI